MSTTRAADPRPARTRAAIFRAVEQITEATGQVTVNEIVRTAGISRSAFYTQFSDLDGLATAILTDAFHEIGADDVVDRSSDHPDARAIARRAATRLVEHIDSRRRFYQAALDWRVSDGVHHTLVEAFGDQVLASMDVMGDQLPSGLRRDDAARYIGGGAVALITAWLRDADPAPPVEMSTRLLAVMPAWLVGPTT